VGSQAEVIAMAGVDTAPDFLRIEEAAKVLRIGRTSAYELAREFLATAGASGLPVVRVGHQVRVPRRRLEELAGGPITWPTAVRDLPLRESPQRRSMRRTQSTLPFSA
jgi:excisionase family DNA binding protein